MSTKKQGHERIRLYEPDRYEYQDPMLARSLVKEGVLCRLGCLINFTQLPLSPEIMNNYPDIYRRIKSETSRSQRDYEKLNQFSLILNHPISQPPHVLQGENASFIATVAILIYNRDHGEII